MTMTQIQEAKFKGKKTMRLDYLTYKTIEEIKEIEHFSDNEVMEYMIMAVALAKSKGYSITSTEQSKDIRYKQLLGMFAVSRS